GLVRNCCFVTLRIRSKKNRRTKDSLKCRNEAAILRAALLHSEDVQHFSGTAECDGLLLLSHGECGKEDGNEAILSPRNSVRRVPGHLKKKLAVPTFMQERAFRRAFNRQSAQNKRPRREAEILVHVVALEPNQLNGFGLP